MYFLYRDLFGPDFREINLVIILTHLTMLYAYNPCPSLTSNCSGYLLEQPASCSGPQSPYYQGAKNNPGLEPGEVVRQSRGGTHGRWNRIILLPCK